MGKIHFVPDLKAATLKAIEESKDCVDVANDLARIQNIMASGSDLDAAQLDAELRWKYPMIDTMLNYAAHVAPAFNSKAQTTLTASPQMAALEQDYWGIICDTAIKKNVKAKIEDCIAHIE